MPFFTEQDTPGRDSCDDSETDGSIISETEPHTAPNVSEKKRSLIIYMSFSLI